MGSGLKILVSRPSSTLNIAIELWVAEKFKIDGVSLVCLLHTLNVNTLCDLWHLKKIVNNLPTFYNLTQESISCEKSGDTVGRNGVIMTTSNFATLKYKTDSWGTEENGFKMIITAFRNSTLYGCHNGFQCSNDQCIAHELVCDNIHHCIDGADERHSEFCSCKFFVTMFL